MAPNGTCTARMYMTDLIGVCALRMKGYFYEE